MGTAVEHGHEPAALERVRVAGRLLDASVTVPGTSFQIGIDPILGLVPGFGDAIATALSLYIVLEAINMGASKLVVFRMLVVLAIDFLVGSIPVIGTLFDAVWKANQRNAALLERHITKRQNDITI